MRSALCSASPAGLLLAVLLSAAACTRDDAGERIEGTGTLELVEADVGSTTAARVLEVRVEEGQLVQAGDTLAVLTLPTLDAQLEQQSARARSAAAQLRQMERGSRVEDIRRARGDLEAAESEATRATRELERIRALARENMVSAQELDLAQAAARAAAARRDAARAALDRATNGARPEEIEAARAEFSGARAAERAVRATAADLVLVAPFDGLIVSRNAEPGEVLAPGQPVVTVGRHERPWVRIYLNQRDVAQIRIGQRAAATLDDFPQRSFEGRVIAVSASAEFTPRVALTEQEREDMLFGVKIELRDSTGTLKAGMPVTVRIDPARIASP